MHAPVTALYAGLLALLLIALAARVPLLRRKHRVGIGSGGNPELALAVRVHGNATEYVPAAVLLLLLAELNGLPAWSLHAAGSGFFLARIVHAVGLGGNAGYSTARFLGTALSWLVIAVLAATLIFNMLVR
ncbi:MAG TPA: MAPEG family protein [Gammaproteobacteria bacterium]